MAVLWWNQRRSVARNWVVWCFSSFVGLREGQPGTLLNFFEPIVLKAMLSVRPMGEGNKGSCVFWCKFCHSVVTLAHCVITHQFEGGGMKAPYKASDFGLEVKF